MSKVELYNCWDAVVNGTAGEEELDNILSILDFPMESFEGEEFVGDWDATKSEFLGPIPSDVITIGQPMIGRTKIHIEPSVLPPAPIGPIEDTSASFIPQQNKSTEVKEQGVFQTQSPVSVLENNRSSSAAKTLLIKSHIAKRARSKRARKPLHLSPWLLIPPLFTTCPLSTKTHNNSKKIPRDRRRKISHTSVSSQTMVSSSHKAILQFQGSEYTELQSSALQLPTPTVAVKKCTHCQVTKTPQWREGPMGPKTLCNACGVRYRSGRLFPEYRPAASPTFVPTVHSNSHKKVIEMRTKGKASRIEESPPTEFVPMSSYLV